MRVWKRGYDISQERRSPREGNRQCRDADHPRGASCLEEITSEGQGLTVGTQGVSQQ
jgi:hypothetical protein